MKRVSSPFNSVALGVAAGLAFVVAPATADDVLLKNGSSFEDVVVERTATHVVVELPMGGKLRLPNEQVERVVVSQSPLERFRLYREELLAAPGSSGSDLLDLVRWAQLNELGQEARNLALVLARAQPDLEGLPPVMASLGYLRSEVGDWRLEDDVMRGRGLVRYDGEWMSRDERAARWEREARVVARNDERRIETQSRSAGPSDNEVALESIRLARDVVAQRESTSSPGQVAVVPAVGGFASFGAVGGFSGPGNSEAYQQYRQQIRSDIAALSRRTPGSIIPLSRYKSDG